MNLIFAIILCFIPVLNLAVAAYAGEEELSYIREEIETVQSVSKYDQPLREVPASVAIITSDEIERLGYRDMSDILNSVSGFYITYDRTMSYIGMRGFGRPGDYNSRVLLLVNGHPLNDDIYGSADIDFGGPIDIDLISRVEIIKGPGYLYFGNNAIFAVINIVTKKPAEIDGLMLSTEAGSLSTYKATSVFGKTINGYDVVLDASYSESKGQKRLFFPEHEENSGIVENSDSFWHRVFFARVSKNDFQIQGMFRDYDKSIPTAANLTVFNSQDQRWKPRYSFIELSYKGALRNNMGYTVRGFYNSFEEKFTYPYNDPAYFMWLDNPKSFHFGAEGRVDWRIDSRNRVLAGAEVRRTHAELHADDITNDMIFVDANKTFNSYSLFSQYEGRPLNNLISYLGLRYDNFTNLYRRFKAVLLPYAALTYMPSDTDTFKLSYSEAYRTPSIFEAFYITDTPDGPYGNADLNIEKWHFINGIYAKMLTERINLTINLFKYWGRNLIDSSQSETGGVIYDNASSKTAGTGGEAEISITGSGGLRGGLSYTYQWVGDDTGQALNSPVHMAKGKISLPVYSKLVLGVEGLYLSKRKKAASPAEWVDGYGVINANISAKGFFRSLDFSLGIYNLLDNRYSDPAGADSYPIKSIEQNGRTFRIKLSYTF